MHSSLVHERREKCNWTDTTITRAHTVRADRVREYCNTYVVYAWYSRPAGSDRNPRRSRRPL